MDRFESCLDVVKRKSISVSAFVRIRSVKFAAPVMAIFRVMTGRKAMTRKIKEIDFKMEVKSFTGKLDFFIPNAFVSFNSLR